MITDREVTKQLKSQSCTQLLVLCGYYASPLLSNLPCASITPQSHVKYKTITINNIIVNNYYTFSPQPTIIILGSRTHKRRQKSFAQEIS